MPTLFEYLEVGFNPNLFYLILGVSLHNLLFDVMHI